ncbi:WD40-repeat-containing domain protein [Globomyces pollinis-pini]|nr:WD40-repeat-containing domain protein [Globomyces pollinis-pini]
MKIELEKQDHFGQITALMFLTGNLLLVGTGSFVKLYDINIPNSPLITLPVLNKSRVHNIIKTRLIPNGIELHNPQKNAFHITDSIPLETIMVLGGKTISFLSTHLQLIKTVEFRDWIQCARVLSDGTIAILYSHNFLELWDLNSGLLKSVSLEVRCMLYSGDIFGTSWNTLNVASGTIFNTVLIWSPIDNQNGVARVQQRLNGHEGVIHGVRFNSDGSMICSTSDDRTVRIWKLTGDVLSPMVLYGHLGRVWKADFVSNYIISISEDATCRVWNPNDGNCIECFSGHGSKHVWSFAVNNETNSILATGGGDCGIRLWDLTNLVETHNSSLYNN